MDASRLAQGLPDTLRKAADAQLRKVTEEVTEQAQKRKAVADQQKESGS